MPCHASRHSASWGVVWPGKQRTTKQKKHGEGSERMSVGKLDKRSFRLLIDHPQGPVTCPPARSVVKLILKHVHGIFQTLSLKANS